MMRLNGLAPSAYPIERPAHPGSAPVPYRESERAAEQARESIVTPASQADATYEHLARRNKSESTDYGSVISGDFMPARFEAMMERPLTSRATQALQSYGTTASFTADLDAHEVLGLDLYA
ncbi:MULTISPECIES: hypothetical protein [Stutzerimonas]|jgi:hypothetical protein|uniref:hypothetical protein n=1 Tax=Stutzerimonas TaxID=2901164 RepID=UPI001F4EB66B|nr:MULTISPECIES: hypothetical protein [Stutzerimonas]MCQ4284323.1 hypothetical protein [Stutzerimonas stutzeri]UNG17430.1 hypothetical protein MKP10_16620 [Stutzerimonas zhaodongensis]